MTDSSSKDSPFTSFVDSQALASYGYLLKWFFLSIIAGVVSSGIIHGFVWLLTNLRDLMGRVDIPAPAWSGIGAVVAGTIIYRLQPHAAGEGIPSYIRGIRIHNGNLLFSVTFYKFWAALATLTTYGNGGIVGPLGRVCSGVVAFIGGKLPLLKVGFTREDQRTAAICGLAAAVGTIFHSSIGGGIFAVEIIQRARLGYRDIFPGVLAGTTAVWVCKAFGWGSFYPIEAVDQFMDISQIGWLLLLAVLVGVTGGSYTYLYAKIARIIGRREGNVLLKVLAGSLAASLLAWAINPELLGTSNKMISAIFSGDASILQGRLGAVGPVSLVLLIMMATKAVCNCITIGSGMSAGFAGPAAICGMLLGAAVSQFLGIELSSPTYHAFVAAGFSGMLASVMNVPLAAAVMTTEVFGLQYSFPAGLAAIVGFQITRAQTIYDYALAGAGLALDEED